MNYWCRISSIDRIFSFCMQRTCCETSLQNSFQVAAADQEVAMQQRQMAAEVGNTADGRNAANQLRLIVCPIMYRLEWLGLVTRIRFPNLSNHFQTNDYGHTRLSFTILRTNRSQPLQTLAFNALNCAFASYLTFQLASWSLTPFSPSEGLH